MKYKRSKGNKNFGNAQSTISIDKSADKVIKVSRQVDEFEYNYDIIPPPFEPIDLISLTERNDTLKQEIEALATNIADFGYGIRFQNDFDYNSKKDLKSEADKEWETLRKLYKNINMLQDLSTIIHNVAVDMYTFGWGMIEIIRNSKGEICSMEYCRACNFRLVNNTEAFTDVYAWEETDSGYKKVKNYVKFKKFVQIVNGQRVYFKEFGDSRLMNCTTGEYEDSISEDELATEIAYFHIHSTYSDYGIPDWINTAITASGTVQSELLNNKYFSDGKILPIAVVVSGGQLTEESAEAIRNGKGIENAYKMLILEASPFETSEEQALMQKGADPRVSIDIKSLTDTNNSDALFRNYQLDGKEKIRDSFRLPPIYTGASSDYNRATADVARQIAEEQIFIPRRKRICDVFNKIVNNELSIKHCELYLKGPEISDIEQKSNIINSLNQAGALTPNILIPIVNSVLNKEIEPWNEELGNIPFELLKMKLQTASMPNQNSEKNISEDTELKKSVEEIDQINKLIDLINNAFEEGGGFE